MWRTAKMQGSVEVNFTDGDDFTLKRQYVRPVGGEFEADMGDGKKRTFIILQGAKLTGERPTFLVNPRSGHMYVPPSRLETEMSSPRTMKLGVTNPEVYHLAAAQRTEAPALNADKEDPNRWAWVKPVVIGFAVIVCSIMFVILVKAFR